MPDFLVTLRLPAYIRVVVSAVDRFAAGDQAKAAEQAGEFAWDDCVDLGKPACIQKIEQVLDGALLPGDALDFREQG
ncbi:MAG: hypothetical protein H0U60_13175 [Blastocatellia bacterium]|nr:hypothetical protein [Blastocatellia bacterium]